MAASAFTIGSRYVRAYHSGHLKHLDRALGGRYGQIEQFLAPHSLSFNRLFDDFVGDTLSTDLWALNTDATATALAQRVNDAEGTMIRGSTGTTANGYINIVGARHWLGDLNCMMETRFQITSVVTNIDLEIGFVDTETDFTLPIVTDVDTPATGNGAADLAVVKMDTGQTLTTMAFVTDGSTAGYNATKTNLGTRTPTAGAWMTVRVWGVGDTFGCQVFDSDDPQNPNLLEEATHGATAASSVEGGVVLAPFITFGTLNTTSKTLDIDYIFCVQER